MFKVLCKPRFYPTNKLSCLKSDFHLSLLYLLTVIGLGIFTYHPSSAFYYYGLKRFQTRLVAYTVVGGKFYDVDWDSDPHTCSVFRSLRQGHDDQESHGDGKHLLQPTHGREHQLRRSGVGGKGQIIYLNLQCLIESSARS